MTLQLLQLVHSTDPVFEEFSLSEEASRLLAETLGPDPLRATLIRLERERVGAPAELNTAQRRAVVELLTHLPWGEVARNFRVVVEGETAEVWY